MATFASSKASYDIPAFGEAGHVARVGASDVGRTRHGVPRPAHRAPTLRHGDDHIFVDVRVTGTQKADWAGIPATGGRMDTRMAALYEFEGDQLVCERVNLDFGEVARQLGAA